MTKPFTLEEIKQAIFGSDRSKSQEPDGFIMVVYQDNWVLIKEDLVKDVVILYMEELNVCSRETWSCYLLSFSGIFEKGYK